MQVDYFEHKDSDLLIMIKMETLDTASEFLPSLTDQCKFGIN